MKILHARVSKCLYDGGGREGGGEERRSNSAPKFDNGSLRFRLGYNSFRPQIFTTIENEPRAKSNQ